VTQLRKPGVGASWSRGRRSFVRILHLTDNYFPVIGGLERSVQSVSRLQYSRGHQVAVVTAQRSDSPPLESSDGVEIHRLPLALQSIPGAYKDPAARVFFPTVPDPVFARAYTKVLRDFLPDVIHNHGWIWFSAAGPSRRSGAAIVSTAHDYGAVCVKKTYFVDGGPCIGPTFSRCLRCSVDQYGPKGIPLSLGLRYSSRLNRSISVWTGLSGAVASAGTAPRVADRQSISVVPSYVPDTVLDRARYRQRPSFVPPAGPYIFYAGSLGPHKGVAVLLEAHARLRREGFGVDVVLAGVPHAGSPLAVEGEGVTLVTSVPHDEVMAAWANAAVGVVPSVWPEPFGQVAVESMASGAPTVVSAVGGLTDVVEDGRSGLVVRPGSAEELGAAIKRLLNDPTLAARLSAGGQERAKQFTVSSVFPQIEAAYAAALASRDSPDSARVDRADH
jgi:glycogen(starch) synthase